MTTPPLPEPFDWCYEWDGPYGTRKFSAAQHNGMKPTRSVPLYTADQMRAYRAEGYERGFVDGNERRDEAIAACVAAAQVPLTDEQVFASDELMSINAGLGLHLQQLMVLVKAVERAHGIEEPT